MFETLLFFISYIVALIIFVLVNFILGKSFTYCKNVHPYFEKWNKYISAYKSQCFKEVYDFTLGHIHCSAGPLSARGPQVGQSYIITWNRIYLYVKVKKKWVLCRLILRGYDWIRESSPSGIIIHTLYLLRHC